MRTYRKRKEKKKGERDSKYIKTKREKKERTHREKQREVRGDKIEKGTESERTEKV